MSIKDAWAGSFPLRVLLSFMATVGAAAVIGMVTLISEVRTNSAILQEVRGDVRELQDNFGERLRYLERNRRGFVPGVE